MPSVPSLTDLASMHLLNPRQREKIESEVDNARLGLQGRSMFAGEDGTHTPLDRDGRSLVPDAAILRESIRRDELTIAKGMPPDYTGWQKNQLLAKIKGWSEDIRVNMPSHDQMERPTWANIQMHMQHEEHNLAKIMAWRNGMRILDPQMEDISAEMLRPVQASFVNYQQYLAGMDHIEWTEAQQLEQEVADLDESQYLEFLKLRAMGVQTPKLIQRKTGLSQSQYEACVRRLTLEMGEEELLEGMEDEKPRAPKTSQAKKTSAKKSLPAPHATTHGELARVVAYLDTLNGATLDVTKAAYELKISQEKIRLIAQARQEATATATA